MAENWKDHDQADPLREQMESFQLKSEIEEPLPPRSQIHRRRSRKKKTTTLSFPLIRVLLVLFFMLIIAAVTSPYWLF
ncbi:hypothetical protein [Halalkalibacter alkaliphilus]|uniref:Uncharacterized protein n=1 Tax=Halalkalibacter alkaliphilus TaxID=2917993 RepID=A0A9X2CQK1_9BACI|nr:hypothetical protein [Halalkalibacter alkaliphilus]MCL7745871.1 hypothetical protein [Halalkalibacter alkaliphilus]